MRPIDSQELIASFVNASKSERARLRPPPLDEVPWDDLDVFTWLDPRDPTAGAMVILRADQAIGIRLQGVRQSNAKRAEVCSLCLTVHSSQGVRLMGARRAGDAGRKGDTVARYTCADLCCSLYLRGLKEPDRVQPHETVSLDVKINRLLTRADDFVTSVLEGATVRRL